MMTLSLSPKLLAFMIASLILAIVPGPAVIYLMTQTLSRGRKAGLASVGGVALGNFMNAAAASFGLAARLATSATAFFLIWPGELQRGEEQSIWQVSVSEVTTGLHQAIPISDIT